MAMDDRPVIAISAGDPCGIGPEIVVKALSQPRIRDLARIVVCGSHVALQRAMAAMRVDLAVQTTELSKLDPTSATESVMLVEPTVTDPVSFTPGRVSKIGGLIAGHSLDLAVDLVASGSADALVTAPICKEAFNLAGFAFPGHTEYLAHRFRVQDVLMVMMSGDLRVALLTTHCPLAAAPEAVTKERVVGKLRLLTHELRIRFGIQEPSVAVLALNPHAGENGLFGREELEHILPAIERSKTEGINAVGPFPADTFFSAPHSDRFDACLAMYHDQGLIPVKMRSFGRAVNYTAGLPIIRTSPDHGTAFDIAYTGAADSGSMEEAIACAVELVKKNRRS